MDTKITDVEILEDSIRTLSSISVPVAFFDSIGAPLYRVKQNLAVLYKTVQDAVKEKNEKESEQEVVDVEPQEEAEG